MIFENIIDLAEELATFADVEDIQLKDDCLIVPTEFHRNIVEFITDNEISNVNLSIEGNQIKLTLS